MTRRRAGTLVAIGFAAVLIGIALGLGMRWMTAAGAPVPIAPASGETAAASLKAGASTAPSLSPTAVEPTVGLPNRDRTPGAINPAASQANLAATVCKPGWAGKVRPPAAYTGALKVAQIIEYGYADRNPSHYQEDHLVPLELGGAPRDPHNLWPEPNEVSLPDGTVVGSTQKDHLEDLLHRDVCAGRMTLDAAQRAIAVDWIAEWEAAGRP